MYIKSTTHVVVLRRNFNAIAPLPVVEDNVQIINFYSQGDANGQTSIYCCVGSEYIEQKVFFPRINNCTTSTQRYDIMPLLGATF